MKSKTGNQKVNKELNIHIGPKLECYDVSILTSENKHEIICCRIVEEVCLGYFWGKGSLKPKSLNFLHLFPLSKINMKTSSVWNMQKWEEFFVCAYWPPPPLSSLPPLKIFPFFGKCIKTSFTPPMSSSEYFWELTLLTWTSPDPWPYGPLA